MRFNKKSAKKRMRVRHFAMVSVVFLLVVLLLSQMADSTVLARSSAATGKIAFTLFDNPQDPFVSNIYAMDADGTHLQRLTKTGKDGWPTWSPDGKQVMFSSSRHRISQIFVMNADGKDQHLIADGFWPDWGPNGSKIAYTVWQDDKNTEIYLMNPDGSNQRRLTHHPARDGGPTFSPDGKKIAFLSDRDNPERFPQYNLYMMNADGTDVLKLTDDFSVSNSKPSWSPDGRWIAFTRGDLRSDIYRINVDGANLQNLTNHPTFDASPTWSPDGRQIAFYSSREGGGIYMMNADGTGVVQLTPVRGVGLDWYGPKPRAVTPHQKWLTTWGWLKGRFPK